MIVDEEVAPVALEGQQLRWIAAHAVTGGAALVRGPMGWGSSDVTDAMNAGWDDVLCSASGAIEFRQRQP
eukprot:SAG31_NODE_1792_length_7256_cov_1.774626_3_plen_70_part_00